MSLSTSPSAFRDSRHVIEGCLNAKNLLCELDPKSTAPFNVDIDDLDTGGARRLSQPRMPATSVGQLAVCVQDFRRLCSGECTAKLGFLLRTPLALPTRLVSQRLLDAALNTALPICHNHVVEIAGSQQMVEVCKRSTSYTTICAPTVCMPRSLYHCQISLSLLSGSAGASKLFFKPNDVVPCRINGYVPLHGRSCLSVYWMHM